jgi:hypothetical protein
VPHFLAHPPPQPRPSNKAGWAFKVNCSGILYVQSAHKTVVIILKNAAGTINKNSIMFVSFHIITILIGALYSLLFAFHSPIHLFFKHNFCIKPYVPREPRSESSNRRLYEHKICILHCQDSNSQSFLSQEHAGFSIIQTGIIGYMINKNFVDNST